MHSARILTGIFLTAVLAGGLAPATQAHQAAAPQAVRQTYKDTKHTPVGEPLEKNPPTDFIEVSPEAAALYKAAWSADLEGVKAVVENNQAVIHSEDDRVMELAAEGDSLAVMKYLADHGGNLSAYDNSPLIRAAGNGNKPLFDYIVSRLPSVSAETRNILMVAVCYHEDLEMVKRVSALGDIDLNYRAGHDDTPVSAAAKHGSLDILTYVVNELHADIHERKDNPLRQAAVHNRPENVRFLLEHGANVHARHDEALRMAVEGGFFDHQEGKVGYSEVVQILLEKGANPFAISPEKMAETEKKYPQIADMLKKKMNEMKRPVHPAP
jgi:ankyrin repeat protein